MMQELPLDQVYPLLEPGPVVLLTTAVKDRPNVMTLSWHSMLELDPPTLACVVNENNHSFAALNDTLECVIAIPALHMAEKAVQIGNTSGRDTDKFSAASLTARPAWQVGAPIITECFANLECRVNDTRLVGDYNLFVLEIVEAWTDPQQPNPQTFHHPGYGRLVLDGEDISFASNVR
ncbi:flavin reductase family protein [Methylomonas methanica]|uniref:Flavin reductase domain protein FMN-binding protein n=1 Tax=Methylomonas methanica (strain DSM 25384 / MC09) TaxID=857087 RepID=F9ZZ81_METMM|nr:flavin reductase family protein [Methylomonas methanica]AEG01107.1 flavin reductase domain protein FMN-binding protein [Methylomonas methanica MC09]